MRKILCGTLALLLVLVALGILPGMTQERGHAAGQFALSLDGVMAGWLHSGEGGHATSDVVTEKLGPDRIARKHIAGVKYEDIVINCGTGMSKNFYEWMKDSFDHKHTRKDGALIVANYDFKELTRLTFYNGLVTEIGMPALDATSKEPAFFTVKLSPSRTTVSSGDDKVPPPPPPHRKQRVFLPANFRLEIDGLDCSKVAKIDSITLKQKVVEDSAGEQKIIGPEIFSTEVSNLKITIDTPSAQTWRTWFNDFVILGGNSADREKDGTLVFLDQDMKTELAKFKLKHLGIFGLHPPIAPKLCCDACALLVPSPDAGGLRHLVADLYCEEIEALFIIPASD